MRIIYIFPWCKKKNKPCEKCKEKCKEKIEQGQLKEKNETE